MSNGTIKFYKNKDRNVKENIKKYVPQHELLGIEPENYPSQQLPPNTPVASEPIPSRSRVQSYALRVESPIGNGPVPNIGNNMEHTWATVDREIVDDISNEFDLNHKMIDNNDFYTSQALGLEEDTKVENQQVSNLIENQFMSVLNDLNEEFYLLLVKGVAICSGPKAQIEEQVSALMFGEHELCLHDSISQDDIVVIKKISIKAGVFLGD